MGGYEYYPDPITPEPDGWRSKVREVAMSWVGTPYLERAQVKGKRGGVDCATFLVGVFVELGLIPFFVPPFYTGQEPINNPSETYFKTLLRYMSEIPVESELQPGDVLMYKIPGACSCGHSILYIGNNEVVHAWPQGGVRLDLMSRRVFRDAERHLRWGK